MTKRRNKSGVHVKIGKRIFKSLASASKFFGSREYIRNRLKYYDGLMPDGAKIELIDEEDTFKQYQYLFSMRLSEEEYDYLTEVSERLDVTKAWVMLKLFYYGQEQLDKELMLKKDKDLIAG